MTFPSEDPGTEQTEVWSTAIRRSPRWLNVAVFAAALAVAIAIPPIDLLSGPIGRAIIFSMLFVATGFAAFYFKPRTTRICVALLWLGVGVGLIAGGQHQFVVAWLIFGVTATAGAELLARGIGSMREAAATDALTGLKNRAGLWEQCQRTIAVSRRLDQPLTLVHIDLDGFKAVNDTEGHAEGDRILRLCAEHWVKVVRTGDILARIGGDEFLLVLPGSDAEDARRLMGQLREVSPVEWCFGAAELRPREKVQACMERADAELYASKKERTSVAAAVDRDEALKSVGR